MTRNGLGGSLGAYMAAERRPGHHRDETSKESPQSVPRKGLFYAKKLFLEIENMLKGSEIPANTFLCWWKGTNVSKDFWIETEDELIRIHVVPRRTSFNPEAWNTSQLPLKERLLQLLGDAVEEERIPCHGLQEVSCKQRRWKEEPSETFVSWAG